MHGLCGVGRLEVWGYGLCVIGNICLRLAVAALKYTRQPVRPLPGSYLADRANAGRPLGAPLHCAGCHGTWASSVSRSPAPVAVPLQHCAALHAARVLAVPPPFSAALLATLGCVPVMLFAPRT